MTAPPGILIGISLAAVKVIGKCDRHLYYYVPGIHNTATQQYEDCGYCKL